MLNILFDSTIIVSEMWTYYLLGFILLPGIIYSSIAQSLVNSRFNKYREITSSSNLTGKDVAQRILLNEGITDVKIVEINGELTDNYNPKTKTLSLSSSVYNSTSISAIGVASHEVGHAIQHANNYFPMKIRSFVIVASRISSTLLWPLVIIGLLLSFSIASPIGLISMWAGVIVFGLSVIVSLITLPVEFNASNRAIKKIIELNLLDDEETEGARKVLSAAAQTYTAALVVSTLTFIRFLLTILIHSRND